MTVLVFGRHGQVATELVRLSSPQMPVIALGRSKADLRRPGASAEAIAHHAPRAVINASAWTAVDAAETDDAGARRLNEAAPAEMARACAKAGIPFAHVSTDYVFDGTGTRAWTENDPVAPCNAYGRSKLAGEVAVRRAGGRTVILRTSWVFSAHGANFVKTMLRLSETRETLQVVDDQIGGPTPAADIAATLLTCTDAMLAGQAGGTYHFSGAPDVSWADFARAIFRQAGRDVAVTGIATRDYPTPAARPLNSRLSCDAIRSDFGIQRPDWRAGLAAVLKELKA
ncbi:dTDP-4-dehydrorhamnose reductase [uncultured Maritimibacter sp.]|jgi:dTDP-4-dehydrorhamnose reductase|uniref:dTDP-4-dehydrorhamnose reductase n=1 Tax=uncultured Maritimibacter sp. TaxID=991866 RepID=UPI000A715406|nr:dTDP-4-dehydrorhamnose reductase [uncultured Maritimibacter sp.]